MKKIILLAMLCAWPTLAALTTISDTIKLPDGTTFNGIVEITLNETCEQADGTLVYAGQKLVNVANGVFSVTLYPNTACTPSGTSYFVRYRWRGGISKQETWVVGVTTPTTIDAVRTGIIPTPNVILALTQLAQSGAT